MPLVYPQCEETTLHFLPKFGSYNYEMHNTLKFYSSFKCKITQQPHTHGGNEDLTSVIDNSVRLSRRNIWSSSRRKWSAVIPLVQSSKKG